MPLGSGIPMTRVLGRVVSEKMVMVGPVQGAVGAEFAPEEEEGEEDEFLEGVCGEEAEVHGVRVVSGDEVE